MESLRDRSALALVELYIERISQSSPARYGET